MDDLHKGFKERRRSTLTKSFNVKIKELCHAEFYGLFRIGPVDA